MEPANGRFRRGAGLLGCERPFQPGSGVGGRRPPLLSTGSGGGYPRRTHARGRIERPRRDRRDGALGPPPGTLRDAGAGGRRGPGPARAPGRGAPALPEHHRSRRLAPGAAAGASRARPGGGAAGRHGGDRVRGARRLTRGPGGTGGPGAPRRLRGLGGGQRGGPPRPVPARRPGRPAGAAGRCRARDGRGNRGVHRWGRPGSVARPAQHPPPGGRGRQHRRRSSWSTGSAGGGEAHPSRRSTTTVVSSSRVPVPTALRQWTRRASRSSSAEPARAALRPARRRS